MRPLLLCGVVLLLSCSTGQAPVGPPADDVPPTVILTSPGDGAVLSSYVTLTATATDEHGIAGVQFTIDGANLGAEDTEAPYTYTWNTLQGDNATHTIAAGARDLEGNGTTTPGITVTVVNPTTNAIRLVTSTTGSDLDPDGYAVTVGPATLTVAANQEVIVPDVPRGFQPARIAGVADNCTVVGYAETTTFVSLEGVAALNFQVRCASLTTPVERIVWHHQSPVDAVTPALFWMNGDGTDKRLLRDDDATNPEWSVDRSRVYYASGSRPLNGAGIYWHDMRSGVEQFAVASRSVGDPTVPPDNLATAFVADGNQVMAQLGARGTVFLSFGSKPAWAPSADLILWTLNNNVWIGTSTQQNPRQLITGGSSPRWSPNGSKILFWRDLGSGVGSYWIANADGTGETLVTQGTFLPDDGASWSPNGRQFVYASTAGGQSNLWVININGTGAVNITNGTGETNIQPTWFR